VRGLAAIVAAFATACASHSLAPQHATVWGVTLDNDADISARALAAQADALASLPIRPLSRVVMDIGTTPADYAYSVPRIARVSRVMAELGDSSEVKGLSLSRYSSFVRAFVTAFRKDVDIWEIGNEVNGEWVGQAREEMARVQAAYDIVKAVGERTALTLYYNPGCYANRANELFTWLAARHVPPAMGAGLDYVTISYYPGDCNDYWPSAAQWQRVFDRLHAIFPRAKLGFGESGHSGGSTSTAHDIALLSRYTNVRISGDNYIGGYFWWTWAEDAVPKGNAFWKAYAAAQR
jgi:hypothetical protein